MSAQITLEEFEQIESQQPKVVATNKIEQPMVATPTPASVNGWQKPIAKTFKFTIRKLDYASKKGFAVVQDNQTGLVIVEKDSKGGFKPNLWFDGNNWRIKVSTFVDTGKKWHTLPVDVCVGYTGEFTDEPTDKLKLVGSDLDTNIGLLKFYLSKDSQNLLDELVAEATSNFASVAKVSQQTLRQQQLANELLAKKLQAIPKELLDLLAPYLK